MNEILVIIHIYVVRYSFELLSELCPNFEVALLINRQGSVRHLKLVYNHIKFVYEATVASQDAVGL